MSASFCKKKKKIEFEYVNGGVASEVVVKENKNY